MPRMTPTSENDADAHARRQETQSVTAATKPRRTRNEVETMRYERDRDVFQELALIEDLHESGILDDTEAAYLRENW